LPDSAAAGGTVEEVSCARRDETLRVPEKIRANKNRMSWNFDMIRLAVVQM